MSEKLVKAQTQIGSRERQVDEALAHIRDALVGLQFGEVLIVLQDGVIVQIERTERRRFRRGER